MALRDGPSDASTPLPEGGGAQEPIGENFEVDLATGSGSYRVPFSFPPGPRQIKPELSLGYSSGYGNGLVGLGWSLSLSAITRSQVDGQPAFDDARDNFTYGGQRLVPVGGARFRQEVEKDFYRIERIGDGWEVRLTDGTRLTYGATAAGRVALAVARPNPILQWLLEASEDAIGNRISYAYSQSDGHARLHEVRYGPYVVRLDYEERTDPVRSCRLGVESVLRHRLREVRLLHADGMGEQPVKAYRLGYEQAPHSGASRLTSVTLVALDAAASPPVEDALPPLAFSYTDVDPAAATLRPLRSQSGVLPPAVADAGLTPLDVDGLGLPGFLHISDTGGHYWPNLGNLEVGAARRLRQFPTALAERPDRLRVASLSGHGLLDLVVMAGRAGGYYALQPGGAWDTFRPFKRAPAIPILDSHTRFVDLNFDGQADLLYADQRAFYAVLNRGGGEFESPRVIPRLRDRDRFPDLDLSDPHVFMADMMGDGTAALVEVRDRSIVYWPNLGYGRFGAAVRMTSPPDLPAGYDPRRLYLIDVDGDGLTDVVYVDQNRVLCWFNRAGRAFAPPIIIERTPTATGASVVLVDALGQGTHGLLWSGSEPLSGRSTHYFLDIAGPAKANLLTRIVTPNGATSRITYGTSVDEAVHDRGSADAAYLPFPVQVVRRVEVEDVHTGAVVASEFSYHRGFYDRRQRRFLGFGRVERRDIGDAETPDRFTVTHFHTSPPARATRAALQRHAVVSRMPFRTEVYGSDDDAAAAFWLQDIEGEAVLVETGTDGTPVYFAARRRLLRTTTDRGARTVERVVRYEHDGFGNVTLEEETHRFHDGADVPRTVIRSTSTRYADDGPSYLVGLPVQTIDRDGTGAVLSASRLYYDGAPFTGRPLGDVTRGVLARREALAFTDELLADVYGSDPPDLAAAGYFHRDDPELGSGWWIVETVQQADAVGNPSERRDAMGHPVRIAFDAHGIYPTRIENALGQVVTSEFDYRHGQVVRQIGRDGTETRWQFDLHGRLQHVVRPQDTDGQPSIIYEHGPFESPPRITIKRRTVTGASDFEIEHLYCDARGQRQQSRLELGVGQVAVSQSPVAFTRGLATVHQSRYFATSVAYSISDAPTGIPVSRTRRDALDRPIELEALDGGGARRRYEAGVIHHYDAEDADPTSPQFETPRSEYFDAAGRLVSVIERPSNTVAWCTQYERNAAGLLTRVTDHLGVVSFTRRYDLLGRLIELDHREAGLHRYVLDAAESRIEERRGSSRIHREYDDLGRVTALRFGTPTASPVEAYAYDAGAGDRLVGRLARVEGEFGTVDYSYTRCGHLKAKTRTFPDRPGEAFTIGYTYDAQSRPRTITYPNGHVVDVGYDVGGRARSVSGVVSDAEYDPTGYLTRLEFVNGVESTFDYGTVPGRLTSTKTGRPGGDTYQHFRYTVDAVGNPIAVDDLTTVAGHVRDNRTYVYDALYRLVEATGREPSGQYHHVYDYDDRGNLLSRPEVDGGVTLDYSAGRVTGSSAGATFTYDELGNLTSLDGWTHEYDPTGRLTVSTDASGRRVTTSYDHTGARVRTAVESASGTTRTWYCDEAYVVDEDGNTETYVFFNRHRVAVLRSAGEDQAIHADPMGNPTCFSRLSDGGFSGQTVYYPYGGIALTMAFGAESRYRFGSHGDVPATELVHFGVRAYSPRLGRFMQPDPQIVHRPDEALPLPRGLHPYGFVIGNPVVLVDPYGASWLGDAVDWVGDRFEDAGRAIGNAAGAVAGAVVNGVMAVAGAIADVASGVWDGIKAVGGAIWEGIKWAAGAAWEGIKWLGQAIAFLGTWALTIVDFCVTWINPLTWIALGLDQIDHPIANVLSFIIKFARAPLTTTIGLIVGGIGLIKGDVDNVAFKNGMVVFEWNPGSSTFSGTTFGGVVHLWSGNANSDAFEHETYHSYQYAGWGDAFIPVYALTGVWGVLSSALSGNPQWNCFGGVNDSYTFGQPLEMGGELVDASSNCA